MSCPPGEAWAHEEDFVSKNVLVIGVDALEEIGVQVVVGEPAGLE